MKPTRWFFGRGENWRPELDQGNSSSEDDFSVVGVDLKLELFLDTIDTQAQTPEPMPFFGCFWTKMCVARAPSAVECMCECDCVCFIDLMSWDTIRRSSSGAARIHSDLSICFVSIRKFRRYDRLHSYVFPQGSSNTAWLPCRPFEMRSNLPNVL